MKKEEFIVWESQKNLVLHEGHSIPIPEGWVFVKSGNPLLTRRIKAAGEYWVQVHERKHRIEAVGLWTASGTEEKARAGIEAEKNDPAKARKLEYARRSREKKQTAYQEDFRKAVLDFLAFHPNCSETAEKLASAVVEQSTPVGSGTVARTTRIPVEQRAEAAVIAWMRHQTTAYDNMKIARVKGRRFEVRRELALKSRELLQDYRDGSPRPENPLEKALSKQ